MIKVILSGGEFGGHVQDVPNKIGDFLDVDGLKYQISQEDINLENGETAYIAVYVGSDLTVIE